jgi:hypothetical protein
MVVTTSSPMPVADTDGVPQRGSAERYAAFMSYSHALDGALAPALQTSLEQFGRVWYRRRALRVFRDTTNLAATPHLWGSIEQALRGCEWFILLASPESAESKWVRREVDWWLCNRSQNRLIFVVTAGSVAWDDVTGHVDRQRTNALPPVFAVGEFPEPLWVDLRELRAAESTDPAYQSAVVDIAATLHGRPKDDLVGEQIRQHRKRRRSIIFAIVALVVLTLTSIITAGLAVAQRDRAVEQTKVATSRLLLSQAEAAIANDPRIALQLGITARHIHPDPETRSGLINLLRNTRYAGTLDTFADSVLSVEFIPGKPILATGSADGTIAFWDLTDVTRPKPVGQPIVVNTEAVLPLAFSPDGQTLVTGTSNNTVVLWDVSDLEHPRQIGQPLVGHTDYISAVRIAPDGRTLVTSSADHTAMLWDITDIARPRRIGPPLAGHTDRVSSVAFSPNGHTLATSSYDNTAILWDVTDLAHPKQIGQSLTGQAGIVWTLAFAPDGQTLVTSAGNSVLVWDISDLAHPRRIGSALTNHTGTVLSMAFGPGGAHIGYQRRRPVGNSLGSDRPGAPGADRRIPCRAH